MGDIGAEIGTEGRAGRSAVDGIVAAIRTMIAERGLGVGDSLPTERELCERFGTSRNTVREAMRILKANGMVEVRPKIGATLIDNRMESAFQMFSLNVMDVSRETYDSIQGFRMLLEVTAWEQLFERLTDADVAALHDINEGFKISVPVEEAGERDFRLHTRLVSILDNKAILDVYRIMKPVILRIMIRNKTRRVFEGENYEDHRRIIEALAARDRVAYQYLMRSHLTEGYNRWTKAEDRAAT
ncbi:FadR/GntR family transcriptional regulator [Seohaeicola nanhaiensis]|uniref:FadR/GntR family transcriptional regulator n=1 Tax=Seohaeicola nanhaiensis TaxID=1387282 RepID=A0ABV9KPE2_9RHOB